MKLTEAMARKRARYLLALEIRVRLAEFPGYLECEPTEVELVWEEVVWDMADKVWPEDRDPPSGRVAMDPRRRALEQSQSQEGK